MRFDDGEPFALLSLRSLTDPPLLLWVTRTKTDLTHNAGQLNLVFR